MADKSAQLVLDALGRAVAEPAGLPLHGNKSLPGLFATSAPAREAARQCLNDGYLQVVRTETRGKAVQEICAISEKGLAYLLGQVSPRPVLENLVQAVEGRRAQLDELIHAARHVQNGFESLQASLLKVLETIGNTAPDPAALAACGHNGTVHANGKPAEVSAPPERVLAAFVLSYLARWQASGASEDCSLPDLFRNARETLPALTLGAFHDCLRDLHDRHQVYLHPWTGPLYDIPEPAYALLIGHAVAYYASSR